MSAASDSTQSRTKAELWAEVTVHAAFTRTLTTLHSITLLCFLTTIQLMLLARSKYVNSLLDGECEESLQEQFESQLSNLLLSQSTERICYLWIYQYLTFSRRRGSWRWMGLRMKLTEIF